MAFINRQTLKNYFKKGGVATEKHFVDLIDSSLNVVDDGINLEPEFGLKINPIGYSTRLMSFFKKSTQKEPEFSVDLDHDKIKGLSIQGSGQISLMKFMESGHVGINTNRPRYEMDVNGVVGMKSRIGTDEIGAVPADGNWHEIVSNLDGMNCFEIRANANGKVGSGYYSISHAIALAAFGGRWFSRSKIKATTAYYGSFFNKIKYRWRGELHNYGLQIKTRRNYGVNPENGEPFEINYNVTKLL